MGDKITDLPHESEVPPVPLKTYRWEDIRRQKLEGGYPWTYLYKPPFDKDNWEKSKEHEYEPVIPMDSSKNPPPSPSSALKITITRGNSINRKPESPEVVQGRHPFCIPCNDCDDSDQDDSEEEDVSEEITAEELQQRLEERYFKNSPCSSKHEYEISETRSVSPAFSDQSHTKSDSSANSPGRMQIQADKIKQKFKNFKEQISKENQAECTPRMKRKNEFADSTKKSKPVKKNKFNFRKHNVKSQEKLETQSSSDSKPQTPQTPRRRFSLPRLPSFSRSRSSSVKERERKRSQSSETDSRHFFDFGTYPRMFSKKKKSEEKVKPVKMKPKSAPATPTHQRRSPFPSRWINKLIDHKKEEEPKKATPKQKEAQKPKETVVKESIFISLHEDPPDKNPPQKPTVLNETKPEPAENKPASTKMEIDNKNFIFISLHEERFPEKLKQMEEEKQKQEMLNDELDIEKKLHKAETARKFHSMFRRMQDERKIKARRAAAAGDDKPEPVIITEMTDDVGDQIDISSSFNVETPQEELLRSELFGDNVSPESYTLETSDDYVKMEPISKVRTFQEDSPKTVPVKEREVSVNETPVPEKVPRKKLKNMSFSKESKESLSGFEDSVFTDVLILDEQEPQHIITKTYIKSGLEEIIIDVQSTEPEQTARHFKEYEKALEKSRSQTSFEIENNFYSNTNSLARLETPVPPARPSKLYSTAKKKKPQAENKENNYYDLDSNASYNTYPSAKPDKPCRKYRKKRTYSNSTTNTEIKSIDELEDQTINNNIVNAKQLSVSFLPLSSDVVGEPIVDYNLRETSSMIHLNLSDPPLPPKRKKNRMQSSPDTKFNSLPNQRYYSKSSLTPSEMYNNTVAAFHIDTEIEYADDANSTVPTDTPPRRPYRRRNVSLPDDDRTSREVESLPSERSIRNDTARLDDDSKNVNGYAVIGTSEPRRESRNDSMSRRISRRFSDFFTLPRIKAPTNYVPSSSQTLDYRRFPSPSRPPRRNRPNREHVYTNDENTQRINFAEEEHLNFNLATEDDSPEREDLKNLQTDYIFEKMKSRPLPPPPRPTRKPKDDNKPDYSQCFKRKPNDLARSIEKKIMNDNDVHNVTTSTWSSWERRTTVREFEIRDGERREISTPISQTESKKEHTIVRNPLDSKEKKSSTTGTWSKNENKNECSTLGTRSNNTELARRDFFNTDSQSSEIRSNDPSYPADIVTATKLNVSELNSDRTNANEIEVSKLTTPDTERPVVRTDTDHSVFNSVNYPEHTSVLEQCRILDVTNLRERSPSNDDIESTETASIRSRFSSMVPQVGSDDEYPSTSFTRVTRPSRRKQVYKRNEVAVPQTSTGRNHPTLGELMREILQICYSSVGQALQSLMDQVIPEDREKRNEVQAAIWVITIIVAGCLMLGLQSSEKVVHHHHWDFHFPPPH